MKIISVKSKINYKTVIFHGNEFNNVPEDAGYIAVDADGEAYSYLACKPKPTFKDRWSTQWDSCSCHYLGEVDLEGMDWRDTLVKI